MLVAGSPRIGSLFLMLEGSPSGGATLAGAAKVALSEGGSPVGGATLDGGLKLGGALGAGYAGLVPAKDESSFAATLSLAALDMLGGAVNEGGAAPRARAWQSNRMCDGAVKDNEKRGPE